MSARADRLRRWWWGPETHLETGEASWVFVGQPYLIHSDILLDFTSSCPIEISIYYWNVIGWCMRTGQNLAQFKPRGCGRSVLSWKSNFRTGEGLTRWSPKLVATWERVHPTAGQLRETDLGMGQYLLIPFLGEWPSIYQLFWCSPGG